MSYVANSEVRRTMTGEEREMESCIRTTVEALHRSPFQAVLYLAGGASQIIAGIYGHNCDRNTVSATPKTFTYLTSIVGWLISVPGASNTVLETLLPYSRMSMIHLLSKIPPQFCSQQTAEDMALLAYNRALKLSSPGSHVVGVGFTGSLVSTPPKHGEHRFYMSTRTADRLWVSKVTLTKGLRTREEEDRVSSYLLLKATANACKVPATSVSELSESDVSYEYEKQFTEDHELEQLINGQICFKIYSFSSDIPAERKIILPGSFNPLHDGHLKLMEVATSICGDGYPCFEISAVNADKPPLSVSEIKERVKQFEEAGKTVIISNQPYFYKKAELFPGSAFVIGADTAVRLINPKYYDGDYNKMLKILIACKETGCTFLVGGRNVDGAFKVLDDLDVPEELKDMFIPIPAEQFRMDISSTELRKRSGM